MIALIITIAIIGLFAWLASLMPFPDPYARIIQVILLVIAVIYLVDFLLGTIGAHTFLIR